MPKPREDIPVATTRLSGVDRRKAPPARPRATDLSTNNLTADQVEFMKAMDEYKRDYRRSFPTWLEVFNVFVSLGYRKPEQGTSAQP